MTRTTNFAGNPPPRKRERSRSRRGRWAPALRLALPRPWRRAFARLAAAPAAGSGGMPR